MNQMGTHLSTQESGVSGEERGSGTAWFGKTTRNRS